MKRLFYLLTFTVTLALSCPTTQAQYTIKPQPQISNSHFWYPNLDLDLMRIRANAFGNVRFRADDYIQYSPAAILLLSEFCGYEGRSNWGRMVVSDVFSLGIMAIGVNGLKYSLKRMRPNLSRRNSFPSGHTATVFTLATMLHMEYGWRSPWFSIGGYTIAAATGVMRMVNNMHWMSDVMAGALIGIGSVHLGYFLSDLIFKEKCLNGKYRKPEFSYDRKAKIYDFDLLFARRFVLGSKELKDKGTLPDRGGTIALSASIPCVPRGGAMLRMGAGSLENRNVYNFLTGGYWTFPLNDRFQVGTHVLAGYAHMSTDDPHRGDVIAGASVGLAVAPNFKIKTFAEYELISGGVHSIGLNSISLGFSSGFYF